MFLFVTLIRLPFGQVHQFHTDQITIVQRIGPSNKHKKQIISPVLAGCNVPTHCQYQSKQHVMRRVWSGTGILSFHGSNKTPCYCKAHGIKHKRLSIMHKMLLLSCRGATVVRLAADFPLYVSCEIKPERWLSLRAVWHVCSGCFCWWSTNNFVLKWLMVCSINNIQRRPTSNACNFAHGMTQSEECG